MIHNQFFNVLCFRQHLLNVFSILLFHHPLNQVLLGVFPSKLRLTFRDDFFFQLLLHSRSLQVFISALDIMILLIKLDHVQDLHPQYVSYFQQLKFKYFFPFIHNFTFFILSLLKEKSSDHFLEFEYLIHYLFALIIHEFRLLLFLNKKAKFHGLLVYFAKVNFLLIVFLILVLFLRKYLQNYFK